MYKKGDRILADDANRWNDSLQRAAHRPAMFQEAVATLPADKSDKGRVVISPVQAMTAYSLMRGSGLLGVHSTSNRPWIQASTAQAQSIDDGANTFYLTCGKTPITAGQEGYGDILYEGNWYWLLAENSSVVGYCGVAIDGKRLEQWYPGFISVGTKTVDGLTLALATPMNGQSYRVKTISSIGPNTYGRCYMQKATATGWSVTTKQVDVWQAFDGTTPADTNLYVSYVNGRLVNFVEACST